jgi:hypothetical protein
MRKLILLMHVSPDGFVARPDGSIVWTSSGEVMFDDVEKIKVESDPAHYCRVTFPMMESYRGTAADRAETVELICTPDGCCSSSLRNES